MINHQILGRTIFKQSNIGWIKIEPKLGSKWVVLFWLFASLGETILDLWPTLVHSATWPRYWFFQLLWLALWHSTAHTHTHTHTHTHQNAGTGGHGGPSYLDSGDFQIGFFSVTLKSFGVETAAHCGKWWKEEDLDLRSGSKLMVWSPQTTSR